MYIVIPITDETSITNDHFVKLSVIAEQTTVTEKYSAPKHQSCIVISKEI